MYIVAFSITYLLFKVQVKERKLQIENDDILNFFFWGIVGLLIGARLFAVTIYDKEGHFLRNPWEAFLPIRWIGGQCQFTGFQGMSYHGGLVGSLVALIIYARIKKIDMLDWGDMLVAGIPLGYTFGRLGNFINGELYGRVTTLPWGMYFPLAERLPTDEPHVKQVAEQVGLDIAGRAEVNLPRHPSQLYEAFFEGIFLWLLIWFVFRKWKPFKGFVIGCYLIGYGVIRFFIEYTRQPDIGIDYPIKFVNIDNPGYIFLTFWNFTMGQILCMLMIVAGIISLLVFRHLDKLEKARVQADQKGPNLKKLRKKIK
jgi:phosphatidylglycerol:prolipoprotein diacylglycerol transferase